MSGFENENDAVNEVSDQMSDAHEGT